MKEFKFWAITVPLKFYYPISILIFLLLFVLMHFALETFKTNFLYVMVGVFVYVILSLVIFVKKVRLLLTDDNRIAVFFNGDEKYESSVNDLKYIQGVDIEKVNARAPLVIQFSEKKFTFNVFEVKGVPGVKSKQAKFLMCMVDEYSFEKGDRKWNIAYTSYIYSNPNYKEY